MPAPTGRAGTADTSRRTRTAAVYEGSAVPCAELDRARVRDRVRLRDVGPRQLLRACPPACGEQRPQLRVVEEPFERGGAGLDVSGREEERGVAYHLVECGPLGDGERGAPRECFECRE